MNIPVCQSFNYVRTRKVLSFAVGETNEAENVFDTRREPEEIKAMTECAGYLQHYFVAVRGSFTFKFGSIACGVICNGKKDKPRETAHKALKRLEIGFHQFVSNNGESSTSSGGVAEVSDCIVEVRREQEAMRAK